MKRFNIEVIGYLLFTIGLILVTSATFTGCQAEPAHAAEPEPITPAADFPEPPDLFQSDCHPLLHLERSEESQARKQKCGVE